MLFSTLLPKLASGNKSNIVVNEALNVQLNFKLKITYFYYHPSHLPHSQRGRLAQRRADASALTGR